VLGALLRAFALLGLLRLTVACDTVPAAPADPGATAAPATPPIGHVFTIILENQTYNNTVGVTMPVPYLSKTVAKQGMLLHDYYGTSHFSLGNYVSLVSGQAVTLDNQDDCTVNKQAGYPGSRYVDVAVSGLADYHQIVGDGCVYPRETLTIADQLETAGLTWKAYMEDMGNDPSREAGRCGQPVDGIGAPDNTSTAQVPPNYDRGGTRHVTDQYAARHNPFVYFHSVLDSGSCALHVVPLDTTTLPKDLASVGTTPNYVWITPNLCNDGHDVPCKTPGSPDNYVAENEFLARWVPAITRSPAFQKDGLLIITFDETSLAGTSASGVNVGYDGTACCNEPSGPNTHLPGVPPLATKAFYNIPISGSVGDSGGGQTGTMLVSNFVAPGVSTARIIITRCCARSRITSAWPISGMPIIRARRTSAPTSSGRYPSAVTSSRSNDRRSRIERPIRRAFSMTA